MSEAKREKLAMYKAEISAAKTKLTDDDRHETWRRLRDMYGKNRESTTPKRHEIDVPIGFANGNVIRSALTVRNPKFTVSARTEDNHDKAILCEQVVNYEWQHRGHQEEVRKSVNDLIIFGHGWLKAGYRINPYQSEIEVQFPVGTERSDYNYAPFAEEGFSRDFDELVKKSLGPLTQMVAADDFNYIPSREELARQVREEGGIILEDRSTLERVSPFDMLVDPSATSLERAQWIAQRVPVRIDQAKKRKDWSSAAREELAEGQKSLADKPDTIGDHQGGLSGPNPPDDGQRIKWAIVWEFYDLTEGTWCIFSDEAASHFLRDPEQMPHHFGHPFIFRNNFAMPDEFYGIGELERIESLQIELNVTRTDLINDRKRYRQKWVVNDNFIDQTKGPQSLIEVLQSDEDNRIATIDVPRGQSMDGIVQPIAPPQVDPALYNIAPIIISDINEVTGVTDYQRGGGALAAQTATEASIINDGAQSRMREKQMIVESIMREAAQRLLQLTQQYMSRERTLRISMGSPEGLRYRQAVNEPTGGFPEDDLYVPFTAADIRGAFDLMIEPGSSTSFNETMRRRAVNEMMAGIGALAQGFPQAMQMINIEKLVEYYLRYGFSIPNAADFIQKLPEQQGPAGLPLEQAQLTGLDSALAGIQQPNGGVPDRSIAPPAAAGVG